MIIENQGFWCMTDLSDDLLTHIEAAGRVCYKSEKKKTGKSHLNFCRHLIQNGHHSVLEHSNITLNIITDRGVTHELVRHRIASYSQESTRYCNYANDKFGNQLTFIRPVWCEDVIPGEYKVFWDGLYGICEQAAYLFIDNQTSTPRLEAQSRWFWNMAIAERDYLKLIDLGWVPQQARDVLPNSLKTEIAVTMNVREWRHFLNLRANVAAHPQMRELAIGILRTFKANIPILFDDIYPDIPPYVDED